MNLSELIENIDSLKTRISTLKKEAGNAIHQKHWEEKIRLELNYTSNHIEGSTLTKQEVAILTNESPSGMERIFEKRPRKDIYEMITHDKIILYLLDGTYQNEPITQNFIKQLHKELMYEPYNKERRKQIGNWKKEDNEIINYRNEKISFTPATDVADEMSKLINWLDKYLKGGQKVEALHPVIIAAEFHLQYISIHPFYDGNGRTARILTNIILDKYGFPPIIIGADEKFEYNKNLTHVQGYNHAPEHFHRFIAQRVFDALALEEKYLLGNYSKIEITNPDDLPF